MAWERGKEDVDAKHVAVLLAVIGISQEDWDKQRQILGTAKEEAGRYERASVQIRNQITRLLTTHYELLMANSETIAQSPRWYHIQLHGLKFGMMYFGGVSLRLGPLVGAWSDGELCVEKEEGKIIVYSGGCSPLSGWNSLQCYNLSTREHAKYSNALYQVTSSIGRVMRRSNESRGFSYLSFPQALVQLGVEFAPATIYRNGQQWGVYDFQSATLKIDESEITFDFDTVDTDPMSTPLVVTETAWGPKKQGGRIVIGNLLTGKLGSYIGEEWALKMPDGKWTLKAGHIVNPEGFPVVDWDSDIPPKVQVWIASYLSLQKLQS